MVHVASCSQLPCLLTQLTLCQLLYTLAKIIFLSIVFSMEICDPRNNITMCPLCDRVCGYWKLVTACGTARASHLFDNPATVFFSVFMSLWGKIQRKCWSNFTSHIKQTITVLSLCDSTISQSYNVISMKRRIQWKT